MIYLINSLSLDAKISLTILLIGIFILIIHNILIRKQKITFNLDFFLILLYSVISFFIIFHLTSADAFMFIPLMNPDPDYPRIPILTVYACQVISFIIYRYKIKKTHFKPRSILLIVVFVFLTTLLTLIIVLTTGSVFASLYEFSPVLHYIIIKIISFILSIIIFKIGSKIIDKFKEE